MPVPELDDPLPFYSAVWEVVRHIPAGEVGTYGQIAQMIPTPEGVDEDDYSAFGGILVGYAMNAVSSRDQPDVPWHRVVNSKGGISLSEMNPLSAVQRGRLRAEGIEFNAKELIDLKIYGWMPDPDWIAAEGYNEPRPLRKPVKTAAKKKDQPQDDAGSNDDPQTPPQQMTLI